MKNLIHFFSIVASITVFSFTQAQSPEQLNYQAVVHNAQGNSYPANTHVSIRFSIHNDNALGNVIYQERETATTNQFGLITTSIGSGVAAIGNFSSIDWSAHEKWLQVEMDPLGGVAYIEMGTTQLLSVPYALYSKSTGDTSTWKKFTKGIYYDNGNVVVGNTSTNNSPFQVTSNRMASSYASTDTGKGAVGIVILPTTPIPTGIVGEYKGTGNNDGVGVLGKSTASGTNWGYGVVGIGNYMGVAGVGMAGGKSGGTFTANGADYGLYCLGEFHLSGDFTGSGVNTYTSDRKLKKDITPIHNALDALMQLKPSQYYYRKGEFGNFYLPDGKHYGVIAQDLQQVLPELVKEESFTDPEKRNEKLNYLAVNYNELIPILIKAVQEQQKEIDALKEELKKR